MIKKFMTVDEDFLALGSRDVDHGDYCDCIALAYAFGAGPKAVDFSYCRHVLQKHWRMKCNHGSRFHGERATPQLLPRAGRDRMQAKFVANTVVAPE